MLKKSFGISVLAALLSISAVTSATAVEKIACPEGYTQCSIYYDDGTGHLKYIGEGCCG